jgi:hypothetical protein
MKAGTTSLYHYLQGHPQVFVPQYKAPEFFVAESNWNRGSDWYRRQFAGAGPENIAVGEASNVYAKYPQYTGVPARIAQLIPNVRLVYVIRDPIARIRSHYQHRFSEGAETLPFEEAVFKFPPYLNCSRYALQIEQYLEYFPRDQLLVITTEDLRDCRVATIKAVYDFLGVDHTLIPAELNREYYRTKDRAARSLVPLRLRKGLKKYVPASKRFKEFETNVFLTLTQLGWPQRNGHDSSKSFVIPDHVHERLVEQLRDDVRRLRSYLPSGFAGWGIT